MYFPHSTYTTSYKTDCINKFNYFIHIIHIQRSLNSIGGKYFQGKIKFKESHKVKIGSLKKWFTESRNRVFGLRTGCL